MFRCFSYWWDTWIYVYKKRGVCRGLFRGVTLTYLKAFPMVAVSFCVYEYSKELLGLDCHDKDRVEGAS